MRAVCILTLTAVCAVAQAQDLPVYNQYFADYEILNPAFTGMRNCYAVTVSDHHQWMGIKSAPNTQLAFARGRLSPADADNYHGLGMIFTRDQNGSYRNLEADLIYAYHVLLSGKGKTYLSFGLSAAINQVTLDEGEFYNYNYDPVISGARLSAWNPDLAVGVGVYNREFFGGVTASNLLPALSFLSDPQVADRNSRLYIAVAGMKFKAGRSSDIELEPSVVWAVLESVYSRIDVNLKGYWRQNFWLGISMRKYLTDEFTSGLALLPSTGIHIGNLEISYSYGMGFSSIQHGTYGSHTLSLSWRLCQESKGQVPCPAYN
jgi:type IX secretion system PorP/SprF family membrane protein